MSVSGIRVRFAPSPTGHLHIGGARTALFNWLYARKTGGAMVLRIEDTDSERSTRESYEAILESLEWLGLEWDEGPNKDGPFGPYVQSARAVVYRSEAEKLLESKGAYYCFCSPEEVEDLRKEAADTGQPVMYDGRCLRLPGDEIAERLKRNVPHVVRFKIPEGVTRFSDIIRGDFEFDNAELDDFVILKTNGRPTYNFAVVVDDAKMNITHVIRGDDHLSNTPKQILIYRALGYRYPKFAHLPMILGSDKTRLSKRHGATSVQEYKRLGYTSDGLVNYLALLGWSLDGKTEFFTRSSLIAKFSLKRVSKNPAAFDNEKLDHINSEHFQRLDPLKKVALVYDRLVGDGVLPPDFRVDEWYGKPLENDKNHVNRTSDELFRTEAHRLGVIINAMGNRLRSVAEASTRLAYFFKDEYAQNKRAVEKHLSSRHALDMLDRLADDFENLDPFVRDNIEKLVRDTAEKLGVQAGELIHPCRVALTGDDVSPDIFAVVHLLGRRKSVERLRKAVLDFRAASC